MTSPSTVFITSLPRSGSTLLWSVFNNISGRTAFYEPVNEILPTHLAHDTPTTERHPQAASYWEAYRPVLEELPGKFRPEFAVTRLLLEEDAAFPDLESYFRFLIDVAGEQAAALKCLRCDFRLPWLKRRFPEAKLVHLRRNPRDCWFSMVRDLPSNQRLDPTRNGDVFLLAYRASLTSRLPFLLGETARTSYHGLYLLWRLAALMGERRADLVVDFDEELLARPVETLERLLALSGDRQADPEALAKLIRRPETGQWRECAENAFFETAEAECEDLLNSLGLSEGFGRVPLEDIRRSHAKAWSERCDNASEKAVETGLLLWQEQLDTRVRSNRRYDEMLEGLKSNAEGQIEALGAEVQKVRALSDQACANAEKALAEMQRRLVVLEKTNAELVAAEASSKELVRGQARTVERLARTLALRTKGTAPLSEQCENQAGRVATLEREVLEKDRRFEELKREYDALAPLLQRMDWQLRELMHSRLLEPDPQPRRETRASGFAFWRKKTQE